MFFYKYLRVKHMILVFYLILQWDLSIAHNQKWLTRMVYKKKGGKKPPLKANINYIQFLKAINQYIFT